LKGLFLLLTLIEGNEGSRRINPKCCGLGKNGSRTFSGFLIF